MNKRIWIILGILTFIMVIVAFNIKNEVVKKKKNENNSLDIVLTSLSYSVDSTSGRVDRKSIFLSDNLYVLTVEKTNDNNELEVMEYAVDANKWKDFEDILGKYDLEEMSLKKIEEKDLENIESISIEYEKKGKKIEYNITSNMKLSNKEKKIFNKVSKYLKKLEIKDNSINVENRENY